MITNPVINGQLQISSTAQIQYTIVNLAGNNIITRQLQKGNNTVDVSSLAKGIYILSAGSETLKFVIQ